MTPAYVPCLVDGSPPLCLCAGGKKSPEKEAQRRKGASDGGKGAQGGSGG